MDIQIKRIDKTLPMPKYHSAGAVAFDLYARQETELDPFTPQIIPANFIIKVPSGYFLLVASRSSTPLRKSVIVANGIGVIDQDYCGEKDEIGVILLNFSNKKVIVEKGERIAQAILVKIAVASNFLETEFETSNSRGGFGSTGTK